MPEASSLSPGAAVDIASRLKRIEDGSNRLYHRDFLGLSWLASYVADVDMVCDEVERLKAQVAGQAEVIAAVRKFIVILPVSAPIGWTAKHVAVQTALARLDALEHAQREDVARKESELPTIDEMAGSWAEPADEHAQRNAQAVTQADMEAKA